MPGGDPISPILLRSAQGRPGRLPQPVGQDHRRTGNRHDRVDGRDLRGRGLQITVIVDLRVLPDGDAESARGRGQIGGRVTILQADEVKLVLPQSRPPVQNWRLEGAVNNRLY